MAGGPSTPALAASVSTAGGLGFLAAGYKSVEAVQRELHEIRSLLPDSAPYGVNLFAPPGHGAGVAGVPAYAERLREEADRRGITVGQPSVPRRSFVLYVLDFDHDGTAKGVVGVDI